MLGSLPEPRTATYRSFANARGQKVDAGIALYFPRPTSFTGESVLELHGHGGPVVISLLVNAAIALGARQAAPGEFSERAFLNDKLDLVQAEAIVDLIGSGTEAAIDFPEEEIDFLSDEKLLLRLQDCATTFDALIDETRQGRVLRDGYQVVIVGKPNAGKSSLMNLLSGQEAAIVTEVAGTTRDILREQIDIEGLAVELVDTAGLRDDPDRIEAEGIRRARKAVESADAVLWIQDASDPEGGGMVEELPEAIPVIVVRNKIDLTNEPAGADAENTIKLSAKTGDGVAVLRETIRKLAGYENQGEGAFTARRRHLDALARAQAHFLTGRQALLEQRAGELLAEELRLCQQALGEITGAVTSDELLGKIFSEFCIGK